MCLFSIEEFPESHIFRVCFPISSARVAPVAMVGSCYPSSFNLIRRFVAEGGYRLYPQKTIMPDKVRRNASVELRSVWENIGWGYCPTNIPQWNQKYKVAYALIKNGIVEHIFVDNASDLSTWLKDHPSECTISIDLNGIKPGRYTWATALVDITANNAPALEMAVPLNDISNGWLLLNDVNIK